MRVVSKGRRSYAYGDPSGVTAAALDAALSRDFPSDGAQAASTASAAAKRRCTPVAERVREAEVGMVHWQKKQRADARYVAHRPTKKYNAVS